MARTWENQVDHPFYEEHQSPVAKSINQAENKSQHQPGPIWPGECPDSLKKQRHLKLRSMLCKPRCCESFCAVHSAHHVRSVTCRRISFSRFHGRPAGAPDDEAALRRDHATAPGGVLTIR